LSGALLVGLLAGLSDCRPPGPANGASVGAEDRSAPVVLALKEFGVAFEVSPSCKLQRGDYAGVGLPAKSWQDVPQNALANTYYKVLSSRQSPGSVELELLDTEGERLWLRNTPVEAGAKDNMATRWHCAISVDQVQARVPKTKNRYLRLNSARCAELSPILGSAKDISASTYTITGASLFSGSAPAPERVAQGEHGPTAFGIRLEAEGGEKRMTVSSEDLDACFVPADRSPPAPGEAQRLRDWLESPNPDMTPPPPVSVETVEAVMGISRAQCADQRFRRKAGLECHTPLLRVVTEDKPGLFGPSRIRFVRERLVSGLYFVDGKLASPEEAITVQAAVRTPGLSRDGAFAESFEEALKGSMEDPTARKQRATRGRFELVKARDREQPTHFVDIRLSFEVPDVETTTETRRHEYVAGKKQVPNPERPKAVDALAQAESQKVSALNEAELFKQGIEQAKKLCDEGADAASDAAGDALGGFAAWATDVAAKGSCAGASNLAEEKLVNERIAEATQAVIDAQTLLANTPETIAVDDKRTHEYQAKHYRRKGTARANLSIAPASNPGNVQLSYAVEVPFDASDVEIPNLPEVKLEGHQAVVPSVADAERALAKALLPEIDQAVLRWGAQREIGGDLGEVKPGTRPWMVLVARQAATNRPIRLLSDLLDNRGEVLEKGELSYQVLVPPAEGRCYVFGATAMDGAKAGLDLDLRRPDGGSVALDRRPDADAAFEVCDLPEGKYEARLGLSGERPGAVLLSMFESTPGRLSAEDVKAASLGLPTMPRRGEALRLDGSGTVAFKGTAGKLVVGKVGDRDGDLIADDVDRCPYEQELKNGYLDDDGCPDEAPAGTAAPAPAPAAVAAAPSSTPAPSAALVAVKPAPSPAPAPAPAAGDDKSKKKSKKTVVFVP
jgi:hypothetical protein